jgi:cytochrome c553
MMIKNINWVARAATLCLATVLLTQTASAAGDPEAGEKLAYTCLGCHGIEGYRNAYPSFRVPKLGGQTQQYLAIALNGYRDGTRPHPTMQAQARSLSEQEIQDVAAYFAGQANETVAAGGSQGASFDKAQACAACHGANGISVSPTWPTLAGQHEEYLEHALTQYKDGTRGDAVMQAQAALVADEDIAVLAEYFASLEGLETTRPE